MNGAGSLACFLLSQLLLKRLAPIWYFGSLEEQLLENGRVNWSWIEQELDETMRFRCERTAGEDQWLENWVIEQEGQRIGLPTIPLKNRITLSIIGLISLDRPDQTLQKVHHWEEKWDERLQINVAHTAQVVVASRACDLNTTQQQEVLLVNFRIHIWNTHNWRDVTNQTYNFTRAYFYNSNCKHPEQNSVYNNTTKDCRTSVMIFNRIKD